MATASERRAAQRRLAREIQTGTYQRGQPGKAYEQARSRQRTGEDLGITETPGGKEFGQRRFRSIADAMNWGQANITPRRTRCYLTGYGRLKTISGDPSELGQMAYRTLTGYIRAMSLASPIFIAEAEARASELFIDLRYVILRWEM